MDRLIDPDLHPIGIHYNCENCGSDALLAALDAAIEDAIVIAARPECWECEARQLVNGSKCQKHAEAAA